MSDNKNIDKKVEELEAGMKKYASKDTVISIGGYDFTPAKLMIAGGIISSVVGTMYGAFEIYKSYQDMQKKIANYVAPDLSEFDKRLAVIEQNSAKTTDYTRDIKNDLKNDIRKLEKVVEDVERTSKQTQRETERDVRELRKEIDQKIKQALDNPLAK